MSTRVGTLEAPRTNRAIWPAAVIASLVMLSIGIGAFFLGRDAATPTPKSAVAGTERTVVGGTAANTPTEISGGLAGGFGQTPVAGATTKVAGNAAASSWIAVGVTPAMQAAIVAAREAAEANSSQPSLGTTTPSEVNGGVSPADRARQQI